MQSPEETTSSRILQGDGTAPKPWKLFVGQVPKNVQEATIRSIFSPYGEIVQLNILRDKMTQISKGTCALLHASPCWPSEL
jgi:CUG-BP- and ETR3-like factor